MFSRKYFTFNGWCQKQIRYNNDSYNGDGGDGDYEDAEDTYEYVAVAADDDDTTTTTTTTTTTLNL